MLLLDAGCLAVDESALFSRLKPTVAAYTVQALKARRQALCTLAQQHLSSKQFVVPSDRILDEGAQTVMRLLSGAGIVIPHFLTSLEYRHPEWEISLCSQGSVYHNEFLTVPIADLLWKEGFEILMQRMRIILLHWANTVHAENLAWPTG